MCRKELFIGEQTPNAKGHFTMCNTTEMFGERCAPTTYPQFCIMSTKLSCGRLWLVYKFAHPTHPFFKIVKITVIAKTCNLKHGFPAETVLIKRDYFETFMKCVTHDTVIQSSPSKMETMLWQQYTGGSPYQLICLLLCCYGNHSGSTSVVISGIKSIQKFSLYRMVLRHWW